MAKKATKMGGLDAVNAEIMANGPVQDDGTDPNAVMDDGGGDPQLSDGTDQGETLPPEVAPTEEVPVEDPSMGQAPMDMAPVDPNQPDFSNLSDEDLMAMIEGGGPDMGMNDVGAQANMLEGGLESGTPEEQAMIQNDLAMAARRRMAGL